MTNRHLYTSLGLLSVTVLSGALLLSSSTFADNDSVVDQISITVPISCTLSGTGMTSHNANIANGTYTADIGTTTLTAFCNDNSGFSIYATGYTGNEIGAQNSNKLVGTSASNNATIDTGTATTAGNPDISNWAMKLTALSSPTPTYPITITSDTQGSFSSYHAVPNEYTKVAQRTSGTDVGTNAEGSTLTTTYAAYISKTQPADTYSGQVIYTLVHPQSAPAPIVCNPNGTTIGTNTSTDIKCMQDISSTNKSSVLSSMTLEQQCALKDSRDGKEYKVAKLADGNVWMTQNLDLDLDSSRTYTNLDTDIGWNGSSYSTATWTPERSTYASDVTHWNDYDASTNPTGVNGYYHPESYDPGDLYWSGIIEDETPVSTGDPHYHLGNYYNWTAAVAMNNSSSYVIRNTDANQSICPTGWTLPKGGDDANSALSGTWRYLVEQYGWAHYKMTNPYIWNTPIKAPLSGLAYMGLEEMGDSGGFWSSVIYSENMADYPYIMYDGFVESGDGNRITGNSVRCVLR